MIVALSRARGDGGWFRGARCGLAREVAVLGIAGRPQPDTRQPSLSIFLVVSM